MQEILSHYKLRFKRIFNYTNAKWYYVIAKTLCIIVGLPLYVALLPLDFIVFLVYALFAFIPILNVFMLFVCRLIGLVCGLGYYIAVLPDASVYLKEAKEQLEREREQARADEVRHYQDVSGSGAFEVDIRDDNDQATVTIEATEVKDDGDGYVHLDEQSNEQPDNAHNAADNTDPTDQQ